LSDGFKKVERVVGGMPKQANQMKRAAAEKCKAEAGAGSEVRANA